MGKMAYHTLLLVDPLRLRGSGIATIVTASIGLQLQSHLYKRYMYRYDMYDLLHMRIESEQVQRTVYVGKIMYGGGVTRKLSRT